MHRSGFFSSVCLGIAVGAAATGLIVANRDAIMNSKPARAMRSVGHTVTDAAGEIADTFRS